MNRNESNLNGNSGKNFIMAKKRKFQVCNGYLLEFDQLARVLDYMASQKPGKKISRKELIENTGLSNRQIESLVSIGSAMGIIIPGKQILSDVGYLLSEHDIFMEMKGTLEWCHYTAASTFKNLIWYEVFNNLLPNVPPMDQDGWLEYFRDTLAGQYTERTIGKHLYEEVRFIIDAYINRYFKKIEILHVTSDKVLYRRRYKGFEPLIFTAIIYDFADKQDSRLLQLENLINSSGSPGVLFAMDETTLKQTIEKIHENGWVRYESTHNLDQVRLKEDFSSIEFLKAYYDDRPPAAS